MKNEVINIKEVSELYDSIKILVENSRNRVYQTVNTEMLNLYWNIGKMIVEKQKGKTRAKYGDALIDKLSKKLTNAYGKGFSKSNLEKMRKLYFCFPIAATLSPQLTLKNIKR